MNAQDLKNSILQQAIEGKLVPQRSDEGDARELLAEIRAEKERLIEEKKIKRTKPLPPIEEDEKPFAIPESWAWVRLSDLGQFSSGKTPSMQDSSNWSAGNVLWVTSKDMKRDVIDSSEMLITEKAKKSMHVYPIGTILMVVRSGILKRKLPVAFLAKEATINQDIKALSVFDVRLSIYVYWMLKGFEPYILKHYRKRVTTVDSLKFTEFANMPVPLPPLTEQKRIVAKIEELLPYIEKYDKVYTKLSTLNAKFPEQMKKSLLQYAMEGKLVPQRAEDDTADELLAAIKAEKVRLIKEKKIKKTKPLPELSEDEKLFEIPENWRWVRLGTICAKIGSGSTPKGGRNSGIYQEYGIPLFREQNIYNEGLTYKGIVYISEELSETRLGSKVYAKDLLLNITGGSIGRCAVVPKDFQIGDINQHILIIRLINSELREYVHAFICSPFGQTIINKKAVGARAGFSAEKCKNMVVPLPPLAEQKRIVARLEELLPYCDALVK